MKRFGRECKHFVTMYPVGSLVAVLLLGGLVHYISNFVSACFFVAAGTYWIGGIFTTTQHDGYTREMKYDLRAGFLLVCAVVATANSLLALAFLFFFLFFVTKRHNNLVR